MKKYASSFLGCLLFLCISSTVNYLWAAETSKSAQQQVMIEGTFSGRLKVFHIMAPQDRGTDVTITVKDISGSSAKVIYAWANSSWGPQSGSEELPAQISRESESVDIKFNQNERSHVLSFKNNGEIVLWRFNPPYKLVADMKKVR